MLESMQATYADSDLIERAVAGALKKANVAIDRKVLSDIAVFDKSGFAELVKTAQSALK